MGGVRVRTRAWSGPTTRGIRGDTVTTVTFEETGGRTLVVVRDLHPSKEALDAAIASGSTSGMPEALDQLDELLVNLGPSV
jgi:uncharacterized protein YndB with AHSA1/START domain